MYNGGGGGFGSIYNVYRHENINMCIISVDQKKIYNGSRSGRPETIRQISHLVIHHHPHTFNCMPPTRTFPIITEKRRGKHDIWPVQKSVAGVEAAWHFLISTYTLPLLHICLSCLPFLYPLFLMK